MRRFLLTLFLCCLLTSVVYLVLTAVLFLGEEATPLGIWVFGNAALFAAIVAALVTILGWPLHLALVRMKRTGWQAYLTVGCAGAVVASLILPLSHEWLFYEYPGWVMRVTLFLMAVSVPFGGAFALIWWYVFHRKDRRRENLG